jgi:hypothetical protein
MMAVSTSQASLKLQCVIDPGMASLEKLKTRIARDVRDSGDPVTAVEALQSKDPAFFEMISPDLKSLKTWQQNAKGMMNKALSEVYKTSQNSLAGRGLPEQFVVYVDPANPTVAFLTPQGSTINLEMHLVNRGDIVADINAVSKVALGDNPLIIKYGSSKPVDKAAVDFIEQFKLAEGRVAPSPFTETTVKEITPDAAPGEAKALKAEDMKFKRSGDAYKHLGKASQGERAGAKKALNEEISDRVFQKALKDPEFMKLLENDSGKIYNRSVRDLIQTKVRTAIDQWAGTSADMNEWAIAMQRAAAEKYGMREAVQLLEDGVLHSGYQTSIAPRIWKDAERILQKNRSWFNHFLDAMYEHTQEEFARQGITEVTLFRGMGRHALPGGDLPAWITTGTKAPGSDTFVGSMLEEGLRPLSSFSASYNTAQRFSSGITIGTRVPVQYVVGTARTGFGCLTEQEFVVLGNVQGRATVQVSSLRKW